MLARAELPIVRRPNAAAIAGLSVAIALLAARALEHPGDPATVLRVMAGAIGIAAAVFCRRRSLVQRAALFVVIELVGGIVAFALVDVPLVTAHRDQIGALAVALYRDVTPAR